MQLLQQLADSARDVDACTHAGASLDRHTAAIVAETILHALLTCTERSDSSVSALSETCAAGGSASAGPAPSHACCAAHSLERLLCTLASSVPCDRLLSVLRCSPLASSAGSMALEMVVCRCLCRIDRTAEVTALADELATSALAQQARPLRPARSRDPHLPARPERHTRLRARRLGGESGPPRWPSLDECGQGVCTAGRPIVEQRDIDCVGSRFGAAVSQRRGRRTGRL
jgi:hypothetical protein